MLNNKQKIQGSFIYRNNPDNLSKSQKLRITFAVLATILYIVPPLFIPQEINAFLNANYLFAVLQTYVIYTVLVGILLLYCLVCAFTRYKLRATIPAKSAPVNGFENQTWLCYTLATFTTALTTVAKIVGICFAFSIWSLVLIFISLASSVFAYLLYRVTKLAYRGDNMVYLSDEETAKYEKNPDEYFTSVKG